jgi:hypothetical protein
VAYNAIAAMALNVPYLSFKVCLLSLPMLGVVAYAVLGGDPFLFAALLMFEVVAFPTGIYAGVLLARQGKNSWLRPLALVILTLYLSCALYVLIVMGYSFIALTIHGYS